MLSQNLLKRRASDVGGDHPGPISLRVGVNYVCGVESAHLAASLDLQAKSLPEVVIAGEPRADEFNSDRPATR